MISGRVPTTVVTRSLVILHRPGVRVGTLGVEDLVRPEQHNQISGADVLYGMRVSRRNVDDTEIATAHAVREHLRRARVGLLEANHRLALDDEKLLRLERMPMIAARHAGDRARHKQLPEARALDEFGEGAAGIG